MNERSRRSDILRAAERLVERYGPAKTTVADVAREAQIGVGTVYLEFPSKEAIVEALSTARHVGVLDAMKRAASCSAPYGDLLRAVFDARTAALLRLAQAGTHACDLVHCVSPAVSAAKQRFADEEKALLVGLLRHGKEAGELRVANPELMATTLLRAYAMFSPPALFGLQPGDIAPALAAMHELVLGGLLMRPGP
jgi:AcrR family transcriptional regulator